MLHRFLKCIAIKCDKFIYLVPAASSKGVYTFIVILAQLWLLGNHSEFVNKSAITVAKKVSKLYAVHVLMLSFSECYRVQLLRTLGNGVSGAGNSDEC